MLSRLSIFVFVAIVSLALVACTKSSQSEVATECSATVTCPSGNVCVNNVCVKLNSGSDSTSGDDSNTTTDTTAPNDTNETGDTSADGGSGTAASSHPSIPYLASL